MEALAGSWAEPGRQVTTVPSMLPDRKAQARIEAALTDLREWKRKAIIAYAQEPDDYKRAQLRRHADDLEYVVFRLGQLLHPMNGDTDPIS